jgi:hypothetical protein
MNEFYDAREACKKDGVTDEFVRQFYRFVSD